MPPFYLVYITIYMLYKIYGLVKRTIDDLPSSSVARTATSASTSHTERRVSTWDGLYGLRQMRQTQLPLRSRFRTSSGPISLLRAGWAQTLQTYPSKRR